ncbi:MAG TPA: GTPase ObgE, partial [Methylotenera sp.]|nr:GTPase ObgE [Methylotenera sp.]
RVFAISAISGVGCKELTYAIMDHLDEVKKQDEVKKAALDDTKNENEPVIINPI